MARERVLILLCRTTMGEDMWVEYGESSDEEDSEDSEDSDSEDDEDEEEDDFLQLPLDDRCVTRR